MIYFYADRVGGKNGGARAGVDILEACLLSTDTPLTVLSTDESEIPARLKRRGAEAPRWLEPPRFIALPQRFGPRFVKHVGKWLIYNAQDFGRRRRFDRRLAQDKPKLVIFNEFPHPHTNLYEKLSTTGKTLMIMHVSPKSLAFFERTHDPSYTQAWALELLSAFDGLIFVSPNTRDAWLAFEPLRDKPSFVIPNCCREEEAQALLQRDRAAVRASLGIPKDAFMVSCLASVQQGKGQDMLVAVLPELVAAIPNLKLFLVGSGADSPWAQGLRDEINARGLSEHVVWTGYREDGMAFTYASDVHVLPSRAESQPLVILEAMALGVPVVSTRIDGIPDMIEEGVSGLLFAPDTPRELARHLIRLYRDETLRKTFAERGAARYWARFSKAQQVSRYEAVIHTFMAD